MRILRVTLLAVTCMLAASMQARRKVELQDGDLILLGNQLYRFGCK